MLKYKRIWFWLEVPMLRKQNNVNKISIKCWILPVGAIVELSKYKTVWNAPQIKLEQNWFYNFLENLISTQAVSDHGPQCKVRLILPLELFWFNIVTLISKRNHKKPQGRIYVKEKAPSSLWNMFPARKQNMTTMYIQFTLNISMHIYMNLLAMQSSSQ